MLPDIKNKLINSYNIRIREASIRKAKARIALEGRSVTTMSPEDLEIVTAEEELKIKAHLKGLGLGALLSAITFGAF